MDGQVPRVMTQEALKELRDIQTLLFDKATNYTKVVLGLGYGGFFALWSGTRQHLPPRAVMLSALLIGISLTLYIAFEVLQTGLTSYVSIGFSKLANSTGAGVELAIERFQRGIQRNNRVLGYAWFIAYPGALLAGLAGIGILIAAWVRWLTH